LSLWHFPYLGIAAEAEGITLCLLLPKLLERSEITILSIRLGRTVRLCQSSGGLSILYSLAVNKIGGCSDFPLPILPEQSEVAKLRIRLGRTIIDSDYPM